MPITGQRCPRTAAISMALAAMPCAGSGESAGQATTAMSERIEVTGTRLPPPNLEAISAVLPVEAEDLRQQGPLSLEFILAHIPSVYGELNSMYSFNSINFDGAGTSTLSLHGLGANRTLVLMNGRRMGPGSPMIDAADLNQIPAPLIKRVDLLSGGASAVYGSDAIAGVINFIMKDDFEGVHGEVSHGFHNHKQQNPRGIADLIRERAITNPAQYKVPGDKSSDGESTVASLLLGGNFGEGKGNAVLYFGYRQEEALAESERDYSACPLGANANGLFCAGSTTSYPGLFVVGSRLLTVADSAGNVRPFVPGMDSFNFAPTNYYRRPTERYNAAAFAKYRAGPQTELYAEFNFHDDHTLAQIAESGLFLVPLTVRQDNPLLSAAWRQAMGLTKPGDEANIFVGRRNVEGGPRQNERRHTSYREVVGVKGSWGEHWTYDAFFQASDVVFHESYRRDLSASRAARTLDVVTNPATGLPACRSVLDGTDPSCVPYNIWSIGGVSSEVLEYLQTAGMATGSTSQRMLGATASVDLGAYRIQFPGSPEGVGLAVGVEQRRERQVQEPDLVYGSGDLSGVGPKATVIGAYEVREAFTEVRLPVHSSLTLSGSYRYSDYDTGVRTNTYGGGFNYSPTSLFRVRGSAQRAIRAPGIGELYAPQGTILGSILPADSCDGATPERSLAECQRSGVTAAHYGSIPVNPAGNWAYVRLGGNPQLGPERGDTFTVGLALAPSRALSVTVDYYDIRIEDLIGGAGAGTTLSLCLDTGDPLYCDRVRRDPASGALWLGDAVIDATANNLGSFKTTGVDIALDYSHPLEQWGRGSVGILGSYVHSFVHEAYKGATKIECAGHFGGCWSLPKWRHRAKVAWSTPWSVDVSATWRYLDPVTNTNPNAQPAARRLPSASYFDLYVSWAVDKRFSLQGGISNVADRPPPITGLGNNGNTYVGTYDALGRRIWVSVVARF